MDTAVIATSLAFLCDNIRKLGTLHLNICL